MSNLRLPRGSSSHLQHNRTPQGAGSADTAHLALPWESGPPSLFLEPKLLSRQAQGWEELAAGRPSPNTGNHLPVWFEVFDALPLCILEILLSLLKEGVHHEEDAEEAQDL